MSCYIERNESSVRPVNEYTADYADACLLSETPHFIQAPHSDYLSSIEDSPFSKNYSFLNQLT